MSKLVEWISKLESRYRTASASADAAKAHYLALPAEPTALPADVEAAKARWQQLDARKRSIAVQLGKIEDFDATG